MRHKCKLCRVIFKKKTLQNTYQKLLVARQCIADAYSVGEELLSSPALPDLAGRCHSGTQVSDNDNSKVAELKEKAIVHKTKGNDYLAKGLFVEATESYSTAISCDPTNAIYYCNRAAAFTSLKDYSAAVQDCQAALSLDSEYPKAYGRLGAAYVGLLQSENALKAYQKALELEPTNNTYRKTLESLEAKINASKTSQTTTPGPSSGSPLGGLDINSLMSNPQMQAMAAQLMSNPSALQNMMNNPQLMSM